MPSLPSLPTFDDDDDSISEDDGDLLANDLNKHQLHNLSTVYSESDEGEQGGEDIAVPVHSTPAPQAVSTSSGRFGVKGIADGVPSSTTSTARFASSIASRSMNGNGGRSHALSSLSRGTSASAVQDRELDMGIGESFDVSTIPSVRGGSDFGGEVEEMDMENGLSLRKSKDSVPDMYLPPQEDERVQDLSLTEALESISRGSSPFPVDDHSLELGPHGLGHDGEYEVDLDGERTPQKKKKYDYSVSLRSEPKVRAIFPPTSC